jgi:ubiquinone/menaquinone biosynthesis C-methylase UbiE
MDRLMTFYNSYDEDNRLIKDNSHKVEFITNIYYIEKYCPPNGTILDACAGTGRYAFHLSKNGNKVTAGDIVPAYVDMIKSKNKENNVLYEVKINDVLHMDFRDNSFDVVLCMGALYHLKGENERNKAVNECIRILKPNGIIIVSYINKYAQMLIDLKRGKKFKTVYDIYKGQEESIFIGSNPREIKYLMEGKNIETIKNIASDGCAYLLPEQINQATDEEFETWLKYHFETCEEESILGISLHGLYIGTKK